METPIKSARLRIINANLEAVKAHKERMETVRKAAEQKPRSHYESIKNVWDKLPVGKKVTPHKTSKTDNRPFSKIIPEPEVSLTSSLLTEKLQSMQKSDHDTTISTWAGFTRLTKRSPNSSPTASRAPSPASLSTTSIDSPDSLTSLVKTTPMIGFTSTKGSGKMHVPPSLHGFDHHVSANKRLFTGELQRESVTVIPVLPQNLRTPKTKTPELSERTLQYLHRGIRTYRTESRNPITGR